MGFYIFRKQRKRWWHKLDPRIIYLTIRNDIRDFRTPAWLKKDLDKGLEAVAKAKCKDNEELLLRIAQTAVLEEVAVAAAECITDEQMLMQILKNPSHMLKIKLNRAAVQGLRSQELLAEVALDRRSDQGAASIARAKITDQSLLCKIAVHVKTFEAALATLDIDDKDCLIQVAYMAEYPIAQAWAVKKLEAMGYKDHLHGVESSLFKAGWSDGTRIDRETLDRLEAMFF